MCKLRLHCSKHSQTFLIRSPQPHRAGYSGFSCDITHTRLEICPPYWDTSPKDEWVFPNWLAVAPGPNHAVATVVWLVMLVRNYSLTTSPVVLNLERCGAKKWRRLTFKVKALLCSQYISKGATFILKINTPGYRFVLNFPVSVAVRKKLDSVHVESTLTLSKNRSPAHLLLKLSQLSAAANELKLLLHSVDSYF